LEFQAVSAQPEPNDELDFGQRQTMLMIKAFLCSESLFFVALILGYVYYRSFTDTWGAVDQALDARSSGAFTVLLLLSSVTLTIAVRCYEKAQRGGFLVGSVATIGLGLAFLVHQAQEYQELYRQSISVDSSIFGSAFYTLTGFHTLHVAIGLLALVIVLSLAALGRLRRPSSGARAVEYYWHFVDVVWLVVFSVVYLGVLS
jgi:heme/copper-type cytochrome/quinol oxidase subunit 3